MYKMKSFTKDGSLWMEKKSNNLAYFDRFKNRNNYIVKIFQKVGNKWEMIYTE